MERIKAYDEFYNYDGLHRLKDMQRGNLTGSPYTGIGDTTDRSKDRVTAWEYNGQGSVTKLTAYNSDGTTHNPQETKYFYATASGDDFDATLVTHTVYPDSSSTPTSGTDLVATTYHLDGKPATLTDQRGVVHTYTYDSARRLALDGATTIPSGVDGGIKSIGRTYTDLGEPLLITSYANNNGTGTVQNEIKYTYDTYRKVSKIEQSHQGAVGGGTPFVSFTYDTTASSNVFTNGLHLKSVYYPVQSDAHLELWYGGDNSIADRLHRSAYEKLWDGALSSVTAQTTWYYYNGVSRYIGLETERITGTYVYHQLASASGNYDGFDRFGRIVNSIWRSRQTWGIHDQLKFGYDYAGNRTWREDVQAAANGKDHDEFYTYDGLHRLKNFDRGNLTGTFPNYTGIAGTPAVEQDFTLDQLGNWLNYVTKSAGTTTLNQTRAHNSVNEIDTDNTHGDADNPITTSTGIDWADPTYDGAGNMTTISAGAGTTPMFLVYDAWNRLTSVTATFGQVGTMIVSYEHDGLGQRIHKNVSFSAYGSSDYEYYYNDRWQLLTEVIDSTVTAVHHWHPFYIDALADTMTPGGSHSFIFDANFNVTGAVTEADDTLVERYHYTPYGTPTFMNASFGTISSSAIGNTHLYTGRERDSETGLQLNRHRYYANWLGRWLTRDPIGYAAGNNLYEYAVSSPTNHVDSDGRLVIFIPIPPESDSLGILIIFPPYPPFPLNCPPLILPSPPDPLPNPFAPEPKPQPVPPAPAVPPLVPPGPEPPIV